MTDFVSLSRRARAANASLWALVVVSVVWLGVDALGIVSAQRYADSAAGSEDLRATSDTLEWVMGWASVVVGVISVVLCLRWLLRAVRNVEPLTGAPPRRSPRWAAWSWFMPVVWWVVPFRVVRELWRSGDRRRDGPVASVVGWWWASWLVVWATSIVANVLWIALGEDVARYGPAYAADLVSTVVAIVNAVLGVAVIRAITERQEAAAAGD